MPVTSSASSQSTRAATNSLAPTQSTMVTYHRLVPKQSTTAVSQSPSQTQSTEAVSRTQGVVDLLYNFTNIHTTEDGLHGLTSSPTESTNDVLEPNYVGSDRVKEENNAIRATASTADITRTNVLIILAVLWSLL